MCFVIYSLIGLMPGDPIDIMIASNPGATPEVVAHLRAIYGLDQPLLLRYGHWLLAALQGDFGYSRTHAAAGAGRCWLPALLQTCKLMLTSFIVSVVLAFALGVWASLKPGRRRRQRHQPVRLRRHFGAGVLAGADDDPGVRRHLALAARPAASPPSATAA